MIAASLCLEFRPHRELVSRARVFVSDLYDGVLRDPDAVSRVALATHELLENVVKYSLDGRSHFTIDIAGVGTDRWLRIRVRNKTTPEHARDVGRVLDEIGRAGDPAVMYQHFLRRCVAEEQGSGLGLARIVAEAELQVHCAIEGDEVTIIAEGPVSLADRP